MAKMNSFEELINCDFNSICAICHVKFEGNESYSLQQLVNESDTAETPLKVYDIIAMLAKFEQLKADNLPEQVCSNCFHLTEIAYKLHVKCKHSVKNLIQYWLLKFDNEKVRFKEEFTSGESEDEDTYECVNMVNDSVSLNISPSSYLDSTSNGIQVIQEPSINANTIIIIESNEKEQKESEEKYTSCIDEILDEEQSDSDIQSQIGEYVARGKTGKEVSSKSKVPMNLKTKGHWAKYQKVPCDICNQYYRRKYLPVHMRTHTMERPYHCGICFQSFRQQGALKTHMTTHEPDASKTSDINKTRPFACATCDKQFKTRSVLVKHEKTHLTVLPYDCTQCDKRFCRLDSLREHIDIVHNKKRYNCPTCNKQYTKPQYLKKHQKLAKHHD